MKLLTKQLLKRFEQVGSQEGADEPIAIAKFFSPIGRATWLATEYHPQDRVFFGYVSIFGDWNDEWGYFSLDELESTQLPLGLKIERDMYFKEQPIKPLIEQLTRYE